MDAPSPFPCPCCGSLEHAEPPGSYEICSVCSWEDDALQLEFATTLAGGANQPTLIEAQRRWIATAGSTAPAHRDPGWRPIDPDRDRFEDWNSPHRTSAPRRAPGADEQLYYWRASFWRRAGQP